eukprot:TRINITY_DN10845_c0_g1_i1.p1 TRINITY_DN10845_c0_g1~~TRINITY_DN10845_c0_g1_i1.p1  ORF type:complete len:123 (-),score=28.35 TRINITY_DN10845_c0_g1_i1:89-457(-)
MQFEIHQDLTESSTEEFRVISDLDRQENGEFVQNAGIKLMKELRRCGYKESVMLHVDEEEKTLEKLDMYGAKEKYYKLATSDAEVYDFVTFGIKPWKEAHHKKKKSRFAFKNPLKWKRKQKG